MQNCTSGVVERESTSSSSSRADNYNAYHKLAVAVAEVWGSAIWHQQYNKSYSLIERISIWVSQAETIIRRVGGWLSLQLKCLLMIELSRSR